MKLSAVQLFLLITFVGLSYGFDGKAQELLNRTVSLHTEGQRLRAVLGQIEKQTTAKFVYSSRNIGADRAVTIHLTNARLGEALEQLLKPLNLTYRLVNGQIVLDSITPESEPRAELDLPQSETADRVLTGTVADEKGERLPGVSIIIKGTQRGTTSDSKGQFSLAVPTGDITLTLSFVGYLSQDVQVGNQAALSIAMKPDVNALDEVVVVGYGTVKKSDLTGSVVSIGTDKITAIPQTNALEALQGRVAGVDLTRSSGEAGAGLNITVRGNRSLTASNAPLVIVDGIAYGSYIDINPNDIKSVEVLKDASAAAIYGSRGANGVIIITTKSGNSGKTKVEFNTYFGPNMLTHYQRMANTTEFAEFRRQAYRAAGVWNSAADDSKAFTAAELANINKGISTDWVDLMVHNGTVQNYHLAVSGGSPKTTFRVSSEFFKENGLLKNDNLKRFIQHANFEHEIWSNLKFGAVLNFNYSVQKKRNTSLFNLIKKLPFGEPHNEDGSVKLYPVPGSTDVNALMDEELANYTNEITTKRIFVSTYADWRINRDLVLRSSFGTDFNDQRTGVFEGKLSTLAFNNQGFSRAQMDNFSYLNWTWENTLTYQKSIGKHNVQGLLGTGMIANRSVNNSAQGKNQPFESASFYNLGSNASNLVISSNLIESQLGSYFGRLNYKFNERYLLTFTLRADGSSVLAEGNKWAYFPSAALAWRLKEERFINHLSSISELKLRASYGVSGNSSISPYQTNGALGKTGYAFDETAAFGYRPNVLANQGLGWEKTASLNFGLDFGFFNNKVSGSLDVYSTRTSDLLMTRLLPSSTGFANVIANVGQTATQGVDLMVSTVNIDKPKFGWTTDLTFSRNKERIVALSTGQNDVGNSWFIGQPLSILYDYEKTGIWQLNEVDQAKLFNQVPGQIRVRDQNNDGLITANQDRIILGQAPPKWTGSLVNTVRYGGLSLYVLLYARVGQTIRSEYGSYYRNSMGENAPIVDYWTPENPTNEYPRPNSSGAILYQSTLAYRDGSFFKIKDIRLSYSVPTTMFGKSLPFSAIRVYGTAKNFITFSKFTDYDPERGGSVSYPLTKQLVFGLDLSF